MVSNVLKTTSEASFTLSQLTIPVNITKSVDLRYFHLKQLGTYKCAQYS